VIKPKNQSGIFVISNLGGRLKSIHSETPIGKKEFEFFPCFHPIENPLVFFKTIPIFFSSSPSNEVFGKFTLNSIPIRNRHQKSALQII
jgi:hypothetical protein